MVSLSAGAASPAPVAGCAPRLPTASVSGRPAFVVDPVTHGDVTLHRLMMPLSEQEVRLCPGHGETPPVVSAVGLDDNHAVSMSVHTALANLAAPSHFASLMRVSRGAGRNAFPLCLQTSVAAAYDAGFVTALDEQPTFLVVRGQPLGGGDELTLLCHASLRVRISGPLEDASVTETALALHRLLHPATGFSACSCTRVLAHNAQQLLPCSPAGVAASGMTRSAEPVCGPSYLPTETSQLLPARPAPFCLQAVHQTVRAAATASVAECSSKNAALLLPLTGSPNGIVLPSAARRSAFSAVPFVAGSNVAAYVDGLDRVPVVSVA